jgi:hypothetical protein
MESSPLLLDEGDASGGKMIRFCNTNNSTNEGVDGWTAGSTTPSTSDSASSGSSGTPPTSRPFFPSPEALETAVWTTASEYSSTGHFTSDDDDGSDYSSGSYSDSYSGSGSGSDDDYTEDGTENFMASMLRRPNAGVAGHPPAPAGGAVPKMAMPSPFAAPEGLPFGGAEGLPFTLESLKRDLEKVGRAIISSNVGEIAAERAHTLSSINWLASHIPNAVLDKLGHETKETWEHAEEDAEAEDDCPSREGSIDVEQRTVGSDSMSEVSDLSQHDDASSFEDDEETTELVDFADVSNVPISYGDLAPFAHSRASSVSPDEQVGVPTSGFLDEIGEVNSRKGNSCAPTQRQSTSISSTRALDVVQVSDRQGTSTPLDMNDGSPVVREGPPTNTNTSVHADGLGILDMIPVKKATHNLPADGSMPNDKNFGKGPNGGPTRSIGRLDPTLINRVMKQNQSATDPRALPYSSKYRCALLLVDISGFTKLSRLLDPESLSKVRACFFSFCVSNPFGML